MAVTSLRQWRNGEKFTARDYLYEREQIIAEVNRLAGLLTGSSDLSVNSILVNGVDIARGQALYTSSSQPNDAITGDIWYDNN